MNELDDATLVAFVDGELEPTAMREVAALVARDAAAEDKVRRLRASATLVRAAFSDPRYQVVPAALSERLARAELGWPSRRRTFGLAAAASIAALLLGISGGVALRDAGTPLSQPDNPLLADIAEYHAVYAREGGDFGAVPATQAADIESFVEKLLHRPVRIPDLSQFGLTFQGARLLVADDRAVVQLLYSRAGQTGRPLGLCIAAGMPERASLRVTHRDGVTLAQWGERGFTYVLVGWDRPDVLTRLAGHLRPHPAVL
jgi:anti-sigma factor RsiW